MKWCWCLSSEALKGYSLFLIYETNYSVVLVCTPLNSRLLADPFYPSKSQVVVVVVKNSFSVLYGTGTGFIPGTSVFSYHYHSINTPCIFH